MDTTEAAPIEAPKPEEKRFRIEVSLASRINLADFQNAVPLVRDLSVVNGTDVPGNALELEITSEPAFLRPRCWRFDRVGAGQKYNVTDVDVQLDGGLLSRLTEAEKATVTIRLRAAGSEALCAEELVVELLPRNQWGGTGQISEMIAAFVQPNDPAVDRILKKASEILVANGKSGAIDGYGEGAAGHST